MPYANRDHSEGIEFCHGLPCKKKDAGIPVYVSELGVLVYIFSKERIKRAECLWLVYQFPQR